MFRSLRFSESSSDLFKVSGLSTHLLKHADTIRLRRSNDARNRASSTEHAWHSAGAPLRCLPGLSEPLAVLVRKRS
jgi:hypothetical protein